MIAVTMDGSKLKLHSTPQHTELYRFLEGWFMALIKKIDEMPSIMIL